MTASFSSLKNRLTKNQKRLKNYLDQNGLEAYRLYHKDIPEYPYLIDIYGHQAVIYEQGKILTEDDPLRISHQEDISRAIEECLHIKSDHQHFKIREKMKGNQQYTPLDSSSLDFFKIEEPPFKFLINLERYLDTGLFLDHRPFRQFFYANSKAKEILNLFCYTGSLSVAAAMGGGRVTSIDLSHTYLRWARENFILNQIRPEEHSFIRGNVLDELDNLRRKGKKFDVIILDPPSFSNSKKMSEDLDIQRDHQMLIEQSLSLLHPSGTLHFSTNKRKFTLNEELQKKYNIKETSQWSIPLDFHSTFIHRSFSIRF